MSRPMHRSFTARSPRLARRLVACATLLAGLFGAPRAVSAQSVPGFQVSTYATVPNPVLLSFGPDGALYAGRDPVAAGSATAQFVNRIGVGGSPVTPLGNVAIPDPDTTVLDVAGTISGVPGSLLVGGLIVGNVLGRLSAIHPDGTVATLFESNWANIIEMKFDHTGRLLFTAGESRSIWTSTGGTPTILATLPGSVNPIYITIAPDDRIVVGASDNKLYVYNADGSLAIGALASFSGFGGVEYAPGGAFGTELYVLDTGAGTLVRVSSTGVKTTVGTGFATGLSTKDIAFSAAGDLFVSVINANKVLRIKPLSPWTDLGFALAGTAGLPSLTGTGALAGGDPMSLDLTQARPLASVALFIGFTQLGAPFKGGTLVPAADILLTGLPTNAGGALSLPTTWPVGLPSGLALYFQEWIVDPVGPKGVAASNGLRAITP